MPFSAAREKSTPAEGTIRVVSQSANADVVVTEPRRRQYKLLAIDSVFVVIGVAMTVTGETALGLVETIFFGTALLIAARAIAAPSRLVLSADGLRFVNLGRSSPLFEWSRSGNFHPWSPTVGVTFIAFEYSGPRPIYRGRLARLSRLLTGGNCCLPSTYGMKAHELCRLLEEHRAQAADTQTA